MLNSERSAADNEDDDDDSKFRERERERETLIALLPTSCSSVPCCFETYILHFVITQLCQRSKSLRCVLFLNFNVKELLSCNLCPSVMSISALSSNSPCAMHSIGCCSMYRYEVSL